MTQATAKTTTEASVASRISPRGGGKSCGLSQYAADWDAATLRERIQYQASKTSPEASRQVRRLVRSPLSMDSSLFDSLERQADQDQLDWNAATPKQRLEHLRDCIIYGDGYHVRSRTLLAKFVVSQGFEWTFGMLVLSQLVLASVETDYNAEGLEPPEWSKKAHYVFACLYVMELNIRLFVWRRHYFKNNGNIFDLFVVGLDLAALSAEAFWGEYVPSVAFLRCLRMMRLARTARVLKQFRELYVIAYSLAGVLKSIFWESVVLFVVLSVASILAVEFIHPINQELAAEGFYDECERCPRAFGSVLHSNLTFFQTMVAGDSWGLLIIPIIERRPETALFFLSLTLLVVLGLMNLILSAIVDKASEVRHIVEAKSLLEKRAVIEEASLKLVSVCEELDEDNDGYFTGPELKNAMTMPSFKEAMKVMDIGHDDLDTIFALMDADGDGRISYLELADALQRLKSQDDHLLLLLIQRTLKASHNKLAASHQQLSNNIDHHRSAVEAIVAQTAVPQQPLDSDPAPVEDYDQVSRNSIKAARRIHVNGRHGDPPSEHSDSTKTEVTFVAGPVLARPGRKAPASYEQSFEQHEELVKGGSDFPVNLGLLPAATMHGGDSVSDVPVNLSLLPAATVPGSDSVSDVPVNLSLLSAVTVQRGESKRRAHSLCGRHRFPQASQQLPDEQRLTAL